MTEKLRWLKIIINILIIFTLGATGYVFLAGSGKLEISGIKIPVSNFEAPLRWFVILLLLKHLLDEKEGLLLKCLNKKIDFVSSLFSFKKTFEAGKDLERRNLLLVSLLFCTIAGIATGIGYSIGDSDTTSKRFIISSTLSPNYYSRLIYIAEFIIFYGGGGIIGGYLFSLIFSLAVNSGLGSFLKKRATLLQFDITLVITIFLITSSAVRLRLLRFYSSSGLLPFPFEGIDIFFAAGATFILAFVAPLLVLKRQYLKTILFTFLIALIPLAYVYSAYREYKENEEKRLPNVVLITIDTTRADHLGMYGYRRDTTPNLNLIAKEGIVFKNAYSQMPTTDPSHSSILTGVYPRTHGLLKNGMSILNKKIPFLPEWFRKRGYITGAITSRAILNPATMELKGFDYINVPNHLYKKAKKKGFFTVKADIAYERAVKWINEYGERPFFLWIHFWDPHGEYSPPEPYNSKFNKGYKGKARERKRNPKHRDVQFIDPNDKYNAKEIKYLISLYDGEIAFADEYVYKLVRYIEKKSERKGPNPLFIITSDHGETLGEIQKRMNYAFNHSELVRYGQIHVPLIFKWEGVIAEGKVKSAIVETVDIAPTIVELLDRNVKYKCDGKSFADILLKENDNGKEIAFAQRRIFENTSLKFLNFPEYGVVTDKWFLISNEFRGIELYDVISDTNEQNDLAEEKKEVVKILLEKLEEWKKRFPATQLKDQKISKDKIDALKALGYIQ